MQQLELELAAATVRSTSTLARLRRTQQDLQSAVARGEQLQTSGSELHGDLEQACVGTGMGTGTGMGVGMGMVHGAMRMGMGMGMVHGAWCMGHGAWGMVHGAGGAPDPAAGEGSADLNPHH